MTAKAGLKVGVAGAGRVGSVDIENVIETASLELVAVCTVVQSEIDWEFEEFISAVLNLVIICTPIKFHKEHVRRSRPEAPKTAWEIYDIALQYPTQKVARGFPRRFAGVFQETAARVTSGDIGKVMSVRSQSVNPGSGFSQTTSRIRDSGGIFVDMTIHDIDVCLYLIGGDETPVTAYATGTANMFPQFAEFDDVDDAFGLVTLESGKVMTLYGNRDSMQGHHASAEVAGTKDRITANGSPRLLACSSPIGRARRCWERSRIWTCSRRHCKEIQDKRDWVLYEKEAAFNLKDSAEAVSIASALMDSLH
ncbi:hypothetical protein V1517DRAFT_368510 [Lipomyces orientalis]|uniref:Uncharacterized protein n=1 Tax=Lipomyces orientalis TaxID=1233043 RepID=A0ACC3TKA0_9ASCO